ncbi:MAG: outer membrane protein assembly factor BamB family protein [Acidimicrobiia bacterium]
MVLVALFATGCDWTLIHSSLSNSGQATDDGFTPAQAGILDQKWRFHPGGSINATPVTFHGLVYLPAGNGTLYALDSTRIVGGAPTVLWSKPYGLVANTTCPNSPTGLVASAAVRDDGSGNPLVYVSTPQGTLQELNGRTGSVVWESRVYTIPADGQNDYFSWSSPTYANGRVYVGISSNCDNPFVRSGLRAFDQNTGALVAEYSSMPDAVDPNFASRTVKPPTNKYVGAGVWTTSASGDGNSIYVTAGSTYDDTNAAHPPLDTNNYDEYSLVKLDATTLAKQGKFAIPQPDGGDPDWGSGAILFSAVIGGVPTQVAGGCNKDGIFYAVRTDVMKPIWAVRVGTSSPGGEVACLSGGVWDGAHLFVTGNDTQVGGTWTRTTAQNTSGDAYPLWSVTGGQAAVSSTRQLDPATGLKVSGSTGAPYWETAHQQRVLGACSINGRSTLIACQTTDWSVTSNSVLLMNATTGAQVASLHDRGEYPGFSTPIWSDGRLIVGDSDAIRAYAPRT